MFSSQNVCKRPSQFIQRRENSKLLTVCYATTRSSGVTVKFKLAYRCEFGQQVCLLGSGDTLGSWDFSKAVPMEWTEGDIWRTELRLSNTHSNDEGMVEYKYLIKNERDGTIAAWKPGGNFVLRLPNSEKSAVQVQDAWDAATREIEIEVQTLARASKSAGKDPHAALMLVAEGAMDELDAAVTSSFELISQGIDPADPDMLAADRKVAAAAQRAAAMKKAVDATATLPSLSQTTKGKAGRRSRNN